MLINPESFEYQICHRLSHMQDRAQKTKNYIRTILQIKKQLEIGDPINEDDFKLLDTMIDDIIVLNEICNDSEDFGTFIHYHSGMDAYLSNSK